MGKRRAFVTGASRGIGEAIAGRLGQEGFEVVAPARGELDLSETGSITAYLARNPRLEIDVLVNNAGENRISPLEKITLEEWQRIQTVNLTAAFLLTQAFAPGMAARGWGRIVNLSSFLSLTGRAGRAAYSASKAGLNALTRAVAIEYGGKGVLVNAVCPGFVATEMTRRNNPAEVIRQLARATPLGRLAEPGEVAEFVAFLAGDRNTFVTGQTLVIDGGYSVRGAVE